MRRRYLGNGNEIAGETIKARKGSPLRVLNDKVFHIIAYNRGGHRTRVGAGCELLPSSLSFLHETQD